MERRSVRCTQTKTQGTIYALMQNSNDFPAAAKTKKYLGTRPNSCLSMWRTRVCETHKKPVLLFMSIFFLKWIALRSFRKRESQTSSFIHLFSSIHPLLSFASSLSGQVGFRVSSKVNIVIYVGELWVKARQERADCNIYHAKGGYHLQLFDVETYSL